MVKIIMEYGIFHFLEACFTNTEYNLILENKRIHVQ